MYDDEFELTFDLSDEDEASRAPAPEQEPVQEAAPEPAAETEPPVEAVPEPAAPAANGRCVLISGGDRGIGAAAARAFWQAGYRVAVLYHTHAEAAAALEKALPGLLAVQCDVASRASCEVAFHTVEQAVGHVDVLVSNAGIAQQKLFTDITPEEWQHMLDVNLSGAFHLCQLALPGMIRRKAGRILTVSSMWGQTGGSCEVHYSAAKAGLIGLTKALAKEEGPSGITVNCVAPGVIDTDMMAAFTAEDKAALAEETPWAAWAARTRRGAAAGVPGRRKRRLHHRAGVRCERRPGDLNHPAAAKLMIRYHLRRSQRRGEKERAKWA